MLNVDGLLVDLNWESVRLRRACNLHKNDIPVAVRAMYEQNVSADFDQSTVSLVPENVTAYTAVDNNNNEYTPAENQPNVIEMSNKDAIEVHMLNMGYFQNKLVTQLKIAVEHGEIGWPKVRLKNQGSTL